MKVKSYIPSLPQVSREVIAVLLATIAAAYIISRFPSVQRLVKQNSLN